MGVFGAVFGCRGVVGFNAYCSGACSGDGGFTLVCISGSSRVVGFNIAMLLRHASDIRRPARPGVGCERENIRPARSKHPKIGVFSLAGRTISRKSHWRGCAGRVFSSQSALSPGLVGDVAHEVGCGGGFAPLEAGWRRVAGVSWF